ncbi:hypothetical protein ACFFX1_25935 [Dactylosporangium sucinum]|uniref:Uncharacterized protein n=1 Tax=Dactylosporangium sucinum TaxID=1424081 RepID=A0A917WK51_9ACTN|nr:hypothetical protein [Dactylosporangium sucinum]GGM11821.1 hypothetical protein GCM10007977_011190 [Dactylosporangium sucinum]
MEIVLADAAPEPGFLAGTAVVVALVCIAVIAAVVVLVVWLLRRTKNSKY